MTEPRESFTNGKPFVVDEFWKKSFTRHGKRFNCSLCGHKFKIGDTARWVYANGSPDFHAGNFFTCEICDAPNDILIACARTSFDNAVRLAKQWGIYGPDWQQDTPWHAPSDK